METIRGSAFSFNSEKLNLKYQNILTAFPSQFQKIRSSGNDPNSEELVTDYQIFFPQQNPFQGKDRYRAFTAGSVCLPVFGFFKIFILNLKNWPRSFVVSLSRRTHCETEITTI